MRILVCGSRHYSNLTAVKAALVKHKPTVVIEGGARGADRLAREAAKALGVPVETYEADWAQYGKAAGPKRNQRMLDEGKPDLVLAFPEADSRGTWDMVRRAWAAGVSTRIAGDCDPPDACLTHGRCWTHSEEI